MTQIKCYKKTHNVKCILCHLPKHFPLLFNVGCHRTQYYIVVIDLVAVPLIMMFTGKTLLTLLIVSATL